MNSDFKHMLGASEKGKVGNECNFASLCCTFSWREKEERAPKSQPTERGGEEAREREKKEDRRKIFSAQTPAPPPNSPTYDDSLNTISTKREKEGATREGRLSLGSLSTRVRKELVDGKEEEKKAAERGENIFSRLSNSPFDPPPPLPHPYPLTRLIEPFDER